MRTCLGFACIAVCALTACDEKGSATPSPSTTRSAAAPSASATAQAAAPKAGCADGATKIDDPGFCITVPAGYKPQAPKPSGDETSILFEDEQNHRVDVRYKDGKLDSVKGTYDNFVDEASYVVKGKGELLGGKGLWFYSTPKSGKGATIGAYIEGPKKVFICESASSDDGPDMQKTLDICKSIAPMG